MVFTPTGCTVEVSWGPSQDELNWHFALERHYGHDEDDDHTPSQSRDLPLGMGPAVRHRANRDAGVVTGYRICERGICVRVAWGPDQCDWHHLCELRAEETRVSLLPLVKKPLCKPEVVNAGRRQTRATFGAQRRARPF